MVIRVLDYKGLRFRFWVDGSGFGVQRLTVLGAGSGFMLSCCDVKTTGD